MSEPQNINLKAEADRTEEQNKSQNKITVIDRRKLANMNIFDEVSDEVTKVK